MRYFLLAIVMLELPMQVDMYLLMPAEDNSSGIDGFNLSILSFCLAGLYAMWLPERLRAVRLFQHKPLRLNWALLAHLSVVCFSVVIAYDKLRSLFEVCLLLQCYLVYLYIANNVRTKQDLQHVLFWMMMGAGIEAILILLVTMVGHSIPLGVMDIGIIERTGRPEGTLGAPNLAGSYFELMITLGLGYLFTRAKPSQQGFALVCIALGLSALFLTRSRGSWIGTAFACSAFMIVAFWRGWIAPKLMFSLSALALCMLIGFSGLLAERILGDDRGSAATRIHLSKMAMVMIGDHPVFGVGANNTEVASPKYYSLPQFREQWVSTIHNKYLLVWLETGPLGLITFLLFMLTSISTAWAVSRNQDRTLAILGLAIAFAVAGQMIHMVVEIYNSRTQIQSLWMLVAIATAMRWMDPEPGPDNGP